MKTLFGGLLLAAGILIAGASGLCSLVMIIMGVGSSSGGELMSMVPLVLVVGGMPFGVGTGLFLWGRALLRSARQDRQALDRPERSEQPPAT